MHYQEREPPRLTLSEAEAAYGLALLVGHADGNLDDAEKERLHSGWTRFAQAAGLGFAEATGVTRRVGDLLALQGAKGLLEACERSLLGAAHLHEVAQLALDVAYADGRFTAEERAQVILVFEEVGIDVRSFPETLAPRSQPPRSRAAATPPGQQRE